MSYVLPYTIQRLTGITDGSSGLIVPINSFISDLQINNTTANAITGGLKIGTTTGGIDVIAAVAVAASATINVSSLLLKSYFSSTTATPLFVQTVTLWNSASLNLTMYTLPF